MNFQEKLKKIQALPEGTRKIIFWVIITAVSSILVFIWFFTSSLIFKNMNSGDIFKGLGAPKGLDNIEKVKKAGDDLKNSMNQFNNVSSTVIQEDQTTTETEEPAAVN
ncbi:MAG: hypothetical protein WC397_01695 [Candidatus Paceibacterota bacterium]|jgi:hypothetical protein